MTMLLTLKLYAGLRLSGSQIKAVCGSIRILTFLTLYFFALVFDEDFVFEERPTIIGRRSIEILLYDFDAYSRHVCIGGTKIDLGQIDLSAKVSLWMPLLSCSEQVNKQNKVML